MAISTAPSKKRRLLQTKAAKLRRAKYAQMVKNPKIAAKLRKYRKEYYRRNRTKLLKKAKATYRARRVEILKRRKQLRAMRGGATAKAKSKATSSKSSTATKRAATKKAATKRATAKK